ncbi:MAG: cyclic pyranopterin monophosphate synthase MoaC [Planctomycetota bacterium]|nr:cyclic pyranopterin monophosphate synthase MoaC [Planctomycetota bacterium]
MKNNFGLSHIGADGSPTMVDVGEKVVTSRIAVAKSRLAMAEATATAIKKGVGPKGEVLLVAKIAGIQAAKQTSKLIPLCHTLALEKVELAAEWVSENELEWTATVSVFAKTGVEMEAMVAASVAALTVYDMCKAIDQKMEITHVGLWLKDGGSRGLFKR